LDGVVTDSIYVEEKPAGIILEHLPMAGQKVKKARKIYLTINTRNVPLVPVPDVADNSSVRQAKAQILGAGFKLGAVELVSGAQDWVYGVKYRGKVLGEQEKVPIGATLTLMVGNGGAAERFVPDPLTNNHTAAEPVPGADES
jgi:beta-lactam-binding protein with PASTA domain